MISNEDVIRSVLFFLFVGIIIINVDLVLCPFCLVGFENPYVLDSVLFEREVDT